MEIRNVELHDALGKPARVRADDTDELVRLTLFSAARTVLWNMPTGDLTIGDAELARNALSQMATAEANGNLWDADPQLHAWTVAQLRTHAPRIFGINSICVVEAMQQ
jgi:hypothetical protein